MSELCSTLSGGLLRQCHLAPTGEGLHRADGRPVGHRAWRGPVLHHTRGDAGAAE
ncbi:hypothetical protein GcM3_121023 [Golovinomyces cichoracearum]|uniref:Uncharacterized protein n=1 Tax=Golovinomyces cichoracearum TaxID=62708 RepID=A0A420I735_9PEZI|nr:hypothetical protein GcM3_121023 [Golovinomyces cichoracearum]